jgi:hypothetical protein
MMTGIPASSLLAAAAFAGIGLRRHRPHLRKRAVR